MRRGRSNKRKRRPNVQEKMILIFHIYCITQEIKKGNWSRELYPYPRNQKGKVILSSYVDKPVTIFGWKSGLQQSLCIWRRIIIIIAWIDQVIEGIWPIAHLSAFKSQGVNYKVRTFYLDYSKLLQFIPQHILIDICLYLITGYRWMLLVTGI
jgi:hypothetical protein